MSLAVAEEAPVRRKQRPRIVVDFASPADVDELLRLLGEAGFRSLDGMDWSGMYPFWLMAKIEMEAVGCVQICPSKPMGYVEFLSLDKTLVGTMRARVFKRLYAMATGILKDQGCQAGAGMVPFDLKSYKRILKKRGARVTGQGNMMVMGL